MHETAETLQPEGIQVSPHRLQSQGSDVCVHGINLCPAPPTGLFLQAFGDLKVAGGDLLEGAGTSMYILQYYIYNIKRQIIVCSDI